MNGDDKTADGRSSGSDRGAPAQDREGVDVTKSASLWTNEEIAPILQWFVAARAPTDRIALRAALDAAGAVPGRVVRELADALEMFTFDWDEAVSESEDVFDEDGLQMGATVDRLTMERVQAVLARAREALGEVEPPLSSVSEPSKGVNDFD